MRYWRRFFVIFLIFFLGSAENEASEIDYCLTYVHIGKQFPKHLSDSLSQARLFNLECPIFLIGNAEAFSKNDFSAFDIIPIHIESLVISNNHKKYNLKTKTQGFWRYALERFFIIG